MPLLNNAIFIVWYLAIAAKVFVVFLLVRRRWIDRYPMFFLWMVLGLARSLTLTYLQCSKDSYSEFYYFTQSSMLVLNVLGAVEAFWGLSRQLQRFWRYGLALMSVCAGIGISIAWAAGSADAVPLDRINQAVGIALSMALIPAVMVFRRFSSSGIAPNAFIHASLLAALFGADAVGWMLFSAHRNVPAAFVIPGATLCALATWCRWMRLDREHSRPPQELHYRQVMPSVK